MNKSHNNENKAHVVVKKIMFLLYINASICFSLYGPNPDFLSLGPFLTLFIHILNVSSSVSHFSCFLFLAQRATKAFPLSVSLSLSLINLASNIYQHFDEKTITESE